MPRLGLAFQLLSGGQTGVDRAVLDVAVERGIAYGGWCPQGGWAEDYPNPPGLLAKYPMLQETPLADPAQRTEWNVRDADACMIVVDAGGVDVSAGTALAQELAHRYRKPLLVVKLGETEMLKRAARATRTTRRRPETRHRRPARERGAGDLRACHELRPRDHRAQRYCRARVLKAPL